MSRSQLSNETFATDLDLKVGMLIVGTVSHLGRMYLESPWDVVGVIGSVFRLLGEEQQEMFWTPSDTTVYIVRTVEEEEQGD